MTRFRGKRIWLVGASHGLGQALARQLDQAGAEVILSARSGDVLNDLKRELQHASVVPVDVTQEASVRNAARQIGRIDGVLYNAGTYDPMRAGDWDTDAVLQMTDVNYNGAVRIIGEVLPGFLREGAGEITLIGSLAGYRGLPAAVGYGAGKAALISLAETLHHDLKVSGVLVRVINPGFIKTRLTAKNDFAMPQLMSAERAAARVMSSMVSGRFRTDFPRPFSWAIRGYRLLPDWLVYGCR